MPKTLEVADLVAERFGKLHSFAHYTGVVTLHGMARRAVLSGSREKMQALKEILAPYIAGEQEYGNFESYHCGGNGTAWLLYKGEYPESEKAVHECARKLVEEHRRTPEGIFTMPKGYSQNLLWIDTAFAVTPFLAYAGLYFNKPEWVEEAYFQIKQMYQMLIDPACGLLHQAIHFSGPGVRSQDHWSRGNGWGIIALTELVNALPAESPLREPAVKMYTDLVNAALRVQDEHGMWHQEMTLHRMPSFVETSGSGLFLYALGVGIELGLAQDGWLAALEKGLRGYLMYIGLDGSVHNTCHGCLSPEDGSIAAYCRMGYPVNDPHAHGPVVLAFAQAHHVGITEL